jgi:hypothetical protein
MDKNQVVFGAKHKIVQVVLRCAVRSLALSVLRP